MIVQIDSENADRNLTSQVTVLTHTPSVSAPMLCVGYVKLGDGSKNLSATGGDFELTVTVGGNTIQPDPQIVDFSTAVRSGVWTTFFPVAASAEVILKVKSPNGADTDVDTTATLYQIDPLAVAIDTLTGSQILKRLLAISGGAWTRDAGARTLVFKDQSAATEATLTVAADENSGAWS